MKCIRVSQSDSAKSAMKTKDMLQKANKRASETSEQTLHRPDKDTYTTIPQIQTISPITPIKLFLMQLSHSYLIIQQMSVFNKSACLSHHI